MAYKTPDVYVKEISTFPPSVAEVETAVPAFIGYTEKADEFGPGDLKQVPTKVTSLLEFEELFGGAPPVDIVNVFLDENSVVSSSEIRTHFYLYDSLRLFFMNGGGKCYIISIGTYQDSLDKQAFLDGLTALKKKDEPTIILFPDAVALESDDLYTIQQSALAQCNDLQDRVSVFDLLESKTSDSTFQWDDGVSEFRNKIGMANLKYGAAYTPWLKTGLGLDIRYRDIQGKIRRGGQTITIDTLTDDTEVQGTIAKLDNAVADANKVNDDLTALKAGEETVRAKYVSLVDTLKTTTTKTNFKKLFEFIYDIAEMADAWIGADAAKKVDGADLTQYIKDLIANALKASFTTLISYDRGAQDAAGLGGGFDEYKNATIAASEWGGIFVEASAPAADTTLYQGANQSEKILAAQSSVTLVFEQVLASIVAILETAETAEATFEANLLQSHPTYKNIIAKVSGTLTKLPPSGGVVGIYARVDGKRGVWKAPANESLSAVSGVTELIDSQEQEDLNVDTVAGKSINAIRVFTGRGVMVWGARTLAGNDNEWRYVPVRRFFNMVEESVKRSTYWAVFEPNDKNTWIKVKSMIENYLVQQWRNGALQGSTPDQAFFVKIGLGITMTQVDILEGRMNVEIGMAVVRPAEFIILKFSHKMVEAG